MLSLHLIRQLSSLPQKREHSASQGRGAGGATMQAPVTYKSTEAKSQVSPSGVSAGLALTWEPLYPCPI